MPDDDPKDRSSTPTLEPGVERLVSRIHVSSEESTGKETTGDDDPNNDANLSDSELFAELEKEDEADLAALREKRMEQLKAEIDRVRDMREKEHGRYSEITDEKEVIRITAQEARCVIHFYHRDFGRCQIMDKHLELIAPHHFKTRFSRVFVESVPWLVEKLHIKILPCVICFVNGVTKDRLIGFEELGNDDAFTTATLELRLAQSGVIDSRERKAGNLVTQYAGRSIRDKDEEDEEGWRSDE